MSWHILWESFLFEELCGTGYEYVKLYHHQSKLQNILHLMLVITLKNISLFMNAFLHFINLDFMLILLNLLLLSTDLLDFYMVLTFVSLFQDTRTNMNVGNSGNLN